MNNKKLKKIVVCENCGREIVRPKFCQWKHVLNKAGWRWCHCLVEYYRPRLLCGTCTLFFEIKHNIDHKTGMEKCHI